MRLRNQLFISRLILLFVTSVLSCTILEDRSTCLCQLELYSSGTSEGDITYSLWRRSRGVYSESVKSKGGYSTLVAMVEKGFNDVCAVWTRGKGSVGQKFFLTPLGEQMDSVYAAAHVLDCRGDYVRDTLSMNKQFMTLSVYFLNVGMEFPYVAEVCANYSGIAFPDLSPQEGEFRYRMPVVDLTSSCRIPRQGDNALRLVLYNRMGGEVFMDFPLGRKMLEAGYDWNGESLTDVVLRLDMGKGDFVLDIRPWREEVTEDVRY